MNICDKRHTNHNYPLTKPPSTIKFCPVTAREYGDKNIIIAEENSAGVMTRCRGVEDAIKSKTKLGVDWLASVV